MAAKLFLIIIGIINGGWMLFDGLHQTMTGRYFGPENPGPWADLLRAGGIDPKNIGEIFILFGGVWIIGAIGLIFKKRWTLELLIGISIATLWYLPFGTLLSVIALYILFRHKNKIFI